MPRLPPLFLGGGGIGGVPLDSHDYTLRIRLYVLRIRDFPYNRILGMGLFDHQSYSREGSGFLGILVEITKQDSSHLKHPKWFSRGHFVLSG